MNSIEDRTNVFYWQADRAIYPEIVRRTSGVTIFNSDNDEESIQVSVQKIRDSNHDIKYIEFQEYSHFCLKDMGTVEFPELLKECLY